MFSILAYLDFIVLMFLGGFWAVRKVGSHFLLHGVLVGFVAQAVWVLVFVASPPPDGGRMSLGDFFEPLAVKVLGSAAGAYVGGRRRKKQLSARAG